MKISTITADKLKMDSTILFQSATIVNGDAAPFEADVLVQHGLIAKVTACGSVDHAATRKIDSKGYYLSPGFIDMHAHSDLYLLSNPAHAAKITQGCTVGLRVAIKAATDSNHSDRSRWPRRHLILSSGNKATNGGHTQSNCWLER